MGPTLVMRIRGRENREKSETVKAVVGPRPDTGAEARPRLVKPKFNCKEKPKLETWTKRWGYELKDGLYRVSAQTGL